MNLFSLAVKFQILPCRPLRRKEFYLIYREFPLLQYPYHLLANYAGSAGYRYIILLLFHRNALSNCIFERIYQFFPFISRKNYCAKKMQTQNLSQRQGKAGWTKRSILFPYVSIWTDSFDAVFGQRLRLPTCLSSASYSPPTSSSESLYFSA